MKKAGVTEKINAMIDAVKFLYIHQNRNRL